jgi:hypothetical protein
MKQKEKLFRPLSSDVAAWWVKFVFHPLLDTYRSIVLLTACMFVLAACEETPCISDPETLIGIEFCDGSANGIVSKAYPINKIQIRNSQVFQESVSKSTASFKIRYPSNAETFWLSFLDSTSKDSVRFTYSRVLNFASESCGYYYGFKDLRVDSVAGSNFERAQILINQGDSSNKVHVRIFW